MYTETQWDLEVDVVCIGAEGGVLAAGIVAANAGSDVYLGISDSTSGGVLAGPLSYRGGDGQTTRHLAGFDYAFTGADHGLRFWPVRAAEDVEPPRPNRRSVIEPFFGAALEQWAHRCASAPHGVVYDRVSKRQMTEMRSTSSTGEKVQAAIVGSVDLSPTLPPLSLSGWLRARAAEADLVPDAGVRLVKLIFEDNAIAGALIETRDELLAVRARENLIVGVGDSARERAHPLVSATNPVTVNVCLVSKAASRFGEVEIVTASGDDNRLLFVDAPEAELQLTG